MTTADWHWAITTAILLPWMAWMTISFLIFKDRVTDKLARLDERTTNGTDPKVTAALASIAQKLADLPCTMKFNTCPEDTHEHTKS